MGASAPLVGALLNRYAYGIVGCGREFSVGLWPTWLSGGSETGLVSALDRRSPTLAGSEPAQEIQQGGVDGLGLLLLHPVPGVRHDDLGA